jgi:hypothetical protein
MKNLVPVSAFTAPVTCPEDGVDLVEGSTVEGALQALANRTEQLKDAKAAGAASSTDNAIARFDGTDGKTLQNSGIQVSDGGEFVYTTPPTRTVILSPHVAHVGDSTNAWSRTNASATLKSDDMILAWDLSGRLPTGASITSLEVDVTPGTPRGPGNRMILRLVTVTDAGSATTVDSDPDDGTAGAQTLALTGLPVAVTNASATYLVELEAGATAAANNDTVGMLVVQYTDPGPRNF